MKKIKLVLTSLVLCFAAIGAVSFAGEKMEVSKADYTQIDGGTPTGFKFNSGNRNDGFYFTLPENAGPYNSDYSVNYYPMNDYCVSLTRDGVTTNICVVNSSYPRDTLKKISTTEYYLRTIDGWTMTSGYLPFKANDKITVSGSFYSGSYQLNLTAASFELDENGEINDTELVKSELTISGEVRASNLEKSAPRGIYFEVEDNEMFFGNNDWGIRYHAKDNNINIALARDTTYSNFEDKTSDGHIVAYNENQLYEDLWYVSDFKFQDGDIIHLCGTYYYLDAANKTKYQFTISNGVILLSEEDGIIYASLLENYGTYLFNQLVDRIDVDIYASESQKTIYDKFHEYKLFAQDNSKSFMEYWNKYVEFVELIEALPQDEDAKNAKIATVRANAIEEITNYADLSLYLPEQREEIEQVLQLTIDAINSSTSVDEINAYVKEYKLYISSVSSVETIYTNQVAENNKVGSTSLNTQYLEKYDTVSLCDLSQEDEVTLSTDSLLKLKNIDTDEDFDNTYENTYPVSKDNTTNSVAFRFKYVVNDDNMNLGLAIKLRGIKYCGFKVLLNDNNYGIYVKRTLKTTEEFLAGDSYTFKNAGEYIVEIGAIDITDTDKTLFYVMVDGVIKTSNICEQLPYGDNRLDIHAEMGVGEDNLTYGSVTLKDIGEDKTFVCDSIGRFNVYEDNGKTMNLSTSGDSLEYSADKSISSYPLSEDAIKLIRNGETTNVAKTNTAILHKYKANLYTFDTYTLVDSYQENDRLVIEGYFAYFNSLDSGKVPYYVSRTELVYKDGTWTRAELTLEETKEDAIKTLNSYLVEDNYTSENYETIKGIVANGIDQINACSSNEEVTTTLNSLLASLNAVQTIVAFKKAETVLYMLAYVNSIKDNYYEEEQNKIQKLYDTYCELIKNATTVEEIQSYSDEFYYQVSLISTKEVKEQEELKSAKEDALAKIRETYGQCNIDSLTKEEAEAINAQVEEAIEGINNATTVEEVNSICDSIINMLSAKFLKSSSKGCGGNIAMTSLIVSLSSLGLILLIDRKRRLKVK